ncbi:MAG: hypothetical protein JSV78_07105 [Phycisphaerales bacterium]|nr:MAG: hypothetical protein JSV78_07105 [Phycisphaerales bacterium]
MNQNGVLDGGDYLDGYSREAGLYVVHDTAQPGPLDATYFGPYSVAGVPGVPAAYANEVLYYPTNIASMEPLPLIVIGHGSGHQYTWYDHIGYHMASYGCIVISHQNNFGGYATAAHTRAVIELQDSIADGALNGKVDSSRIIWIGHSMGGHGVVLAYDLVYDGTYVPEYYTVDDIVLLSPMLPIVEADDHPHHVNFHLWTASGDSDVSGHASMDYVQTFHMHDRATGYRMSTVVQGTGHAWFHDGPEEPSWFEGPCSIGQENTHLIQLGLFLPLIKHYTEGNIPATDFFWRQYERFHPISVDTVDPCIVVTNEYRNGSESGNFYIDDYQTEESLYTSSSGGAVTFTVENVTEGRLDDNNSSFTWTPDDPFNGATQAASYDTSRGVVFDWNGVDAYYEWEVIPTQQNFSDDLYLSFRGAQGTQHPYTLAELGDVTFAVTLRDGSGTTSSINIGAYGGGLEQPYQRQGGWHNEMEVIRIRLTDFLTNGSGLDLTEVAAVRFDVGPSWGSNEGRIVVDELMLTNNYWPYFSPLSLSMPAPPPEFLPPGVPTVIDVEIDPGDDTIVPGSALLHYRYDGGAWLDDPLEQIGSTLWQGTLPPPTCDDTPEFFFSVEGAITGPVYVPHGAPAVTFVAFVGEYISVLDDDFEEDLGWTVEDDPSLMSGSWERGVPADDGLEGDPLTDYDGSGSCYLTGNYLGNSDVDGGPTMLISPMVDLAGTTNPVLRYARWWANDDQDSDPFDVEVSNDGGSTWVLVEHVVNIPPGWVQSAAYVADFVSLTAQVKVRFSCADVPNNSKDEGGVDAVQVFELVCED